MQHGTKEQSTVGGAAGRYAPVPAADVKIGDIMSTEVVTTTPGDTLFDTARHMSEAGISCLVAVDGDRVVGIVTERDVLKAVGGPLVDLRSLKVAQAMSSPAHTVAPDLSVHAAGRIMEARKIRRLPVLEGRQLVGIVTQTDVTRGLVTLIPLRSISEIMTRDVTAVAANVSVAEAARIMSTKHISCVVVMRQDEPVGILTEKDVIRRVVTAQKNPTETRVAEVMSFPIVSVAPDYSVLGVSRKMDTLHLHRVVVMDAGKLCGIVTGTDVMRAVRAEVERTENERWSWMMDMTTQVQRTIDDLQQLAELLRRVSGLSATFPKSADATQRAKDDQEHIVRRACACP